jgi:hypothetical protein
MYRALLAVILWAFSLGAQAQDSRCKVTENICVVPGTSAFTCFNAAQMQCTQGVLCKSGDDVCIAGPGRGTCYRRANGDICVDGRVCRQGDPNCRSQSPPSITILVPKQKPAPPPPPGERGWRIKVTNKCDMPAKFAVRYQKLNGDWVSEGWWTFRKGTSTYPESDGAELRTENSTFYIYGTVGTLTLQGDHEADGPGGDTLLWRKVRGGDFTFVCRTSRGALQPPKAPVCPAGSVAVGCNTVPPPTQ